MLKRLTVLQWSKNAKKGGSKPRLSQRRRLPRDPTKQARYIQTIQEVHSYSYCCSLLRHTYSLARMTVNHPKSSSALKTEWSASCGCFSHIRFSCYTNPPNPSLSMLSHFIASYCNCLRITGSCFSQPQACATIQHASR